jgi:hypothetical protein
MWKQISLVVVVGCVGLTVACGPSNNNTVENPVVLGQEETEGSLVQNVFDVMTQLSTSVVFLSESQFASDTVGAAIPTNCDDDELDDDEDCGEEPSSLSASIAQGRDGAIEYLETRVLTDSQLESAPSAMTLVYRMDPTLHCEDNEECVSLLTDHPIRVAIQSADKKTFVVAIQVGEEQLSPLTFVVGPTDLSVQLDLAKLADVIAMLNVNNDNGEAMIPLPAVAEGLVRLAIQDLGGARAQVSLDVLEAVALQITENDTSFTLDVGVAELAVSADNDSQVIGAQTFVGALAMGLSGSLVSDMFLGVECTASAMMGTESMEDDCEGDSQPAFTEDFQVLVSGLSGSATMDFLNELLSFKGLGLGSDTTSVIYGKDTLLSVDINPDDGRVFDMSIEKAEAGHPLLRFSSILDVGVAFDLTPIQQVLDDIPEWAIQDSLRAVLEGAKGPAIAILDKAVQVVSGTLTMTSEHPNVAPMEVTEGTCVVPADDAGEFTPVSFIETLALGQCPTDDPAWD